MRAESSYEPGEIWDEGLEPGGRPREGWAEVLRKVGDDPRAAASLVERKILERRVEFGKGEAKQPFVLDPIPRIIGAAEWAELERGLAQRARALNALLADVYGERRIISEGVIPAPVIEGAEYFEAEMEGLIETRAATMVGFDLVRDEDGRFLVLEDNTRTPSGLVYAVAARKMSEDLFGGRVDDAEPLDGIFGWIGEALREAGPEGVDEPVAILVTDGPDNSAWYEHVEIANRIGIPLVQPRDLEVRGDELCFRDAQGSLRRADVVLRRTDADRVAEPGAGRTWVGELLYAPLRSGNVRMVNTFGSGLADDKLVYAYVPHAIRFYMGEEPLLAQIPTLDCADPEMLADVCKRPQELVVKPRSESGGIGVVVGSQSTAEELRACVELAQQSPQDYIAQEIVSFSTCPTVAGDQIEPRHVDLRAFAVCLDRGVKLMPGGLTRVALERGSLIVNSSQGGGGKDTWVLKLT